MCAAIAFPRVSPAPQPTISTEQVQAYYDHKTEALLYRYGPGPRIHYHTGIVCEPYDPNGSFSSLKTGVHHAQERLMTHLAQSWSAATQLTGDVLDVGCGLGGGAIFWAQKFGATVTAVTCAPSHIAWIARFAQEARVGHKIRPFLCDAVQVPGENCYDAAVAIESSCHMSRPALFQRLSTILRPAGRVFIADFFFEQPEYEEISRKHWQAPVGTFDEYLTAASEAGFQLNAVEDISLPTAPFWALTAALVQAEALQRETSGAESRKVKASLYAHSLVRQGLMDGGLRYLLMHFSKEHTR